MTCAAHRVNCINSQIQEQVAQQQQQRVGHLAAYTSGCNNGNSDSEKYAKVKSCKLMSTQRTQSIPHQQQQELRAADKNCNGVSACNTADLLAAQQNLKQQQQPHNSTTSKMYDNSSMQHSLAEVANRNAANGAATKTITATITSTTATTNANCVQSRRHQVQQQQQQLTSHGMPLGERNSCSNSNNINNNSRQLQQQQKTYYRYPQSFAGYTRLLSVLLLFAFQHFPSVSASSNMNKHEPMFISRSETFKFVAGDTIRLPCEVANTDPYVVAWKRGIAILTAGNVKVTPDPRVSRAERFNLQIRDAVPQDAGDYICQIATMEPREITHTVEILVPPRIHHISTGGHLQVKKGSSVRIECSASGNPTPNVTWSRKNNILPNGEEKLHSHILSIENVDRHKGGVYICTANNGVGQPASSQVVLHVLYPPEISVERPIVFSGEGHEAMLVCIVHGETQPEVLWFKDTMQLDTTERHIMENRGSRHTLIIRKVHPQDFGNYSCVAENQLGKARKTLQLSGKPNIAVFNSPPISQYKDRYNISWTVDSHTPIEEYKLSFRRLPQGHEVDNSIDTHTGSASSSTLLQMYGGGGGGGIGGVGMGSGLLGSQHNHRLGSGLGAGLSSYGNVMHWGRNDWRDVVLAAMPLSHHYTQGMSYMIRGLDPDQHYEATVQARNRYGWSDLTHSFLFSTSSNDNEMRDLSVTFYGSGATHKLRLSLTTLSLVTLILVKLNKSFWA
ncbi:hemicentin-1 isoform X2 [Zeugodacus cucurbitae]|uniref:hemicentin-1 isoform X2 n=1 Tax=Zeugodacus cucurbitae TaxID=28588 RepID=UPI000596984B|nr:hemicentin-1 isoform X2 [Zeugodacus cucurbitae]